MELAAGALVGPYEIKGTLGAGGMGEVYRARDSRLGRDVAIKILPAAFAADPERLRRFEQEARATGGLSHSNILAIFDVGVHAGSPYIVSELLEGETLRERLRGGALSIRKSLDFGVQIASGLAAAHERGIVHRDLKPENIFICSDGRAKILDFGLAKLSQPEVRDHAATATAAANPPALTDAGGVLGTVGYMSPEQLRGQPVDARSDIFSFGAVLYEMLAGRRAFQGHTSADISSAILKDDPAAMSSATAPIPPILDNIVHHCLEKSPAQRFQSARDLAFQLQSVSGSTTQISLAAGGAPPVALGGTRWRAWIGTTVAAAVLLAAFAAWRIIRAPKGFQIEGADVGFRRITDFTGLEEWPAISPDEKSVAFTADHSGTKQIWIRLLAGGPPLQITKDAGIHLEPRWSRDSAYLFYYVPPWHGEVQGALWQVPALGGLPREICASLSTADVSHDGKRLVFFRLNQEQKLVELVTSDINGSNPAVVASFPAQMDFVNPRWSPDDKTIAYMHSISFWSFDVYIVAAAGGAPRRVSHSDVLMAGLAWLRDGSGLIYASGEGSTIVYLPTMHLRVLPLDGSPDRRITYGDVNYEMPDISPDGRLLASRRMMHFDLWKFPVTNDPVANVRDGVQITNQRSIVQTPSFSPDDTQIAYISDSDGQGNVWVMDLATGATRQITDEAASATVGIPIWSPDGKTIAFALTGANSSWTTVDYWAVDPDGSNLRDVLKGGAWASWSADSKWLYYSNISPTREFADYKLWKVPVAGGKPVVVREDGGMASSVSSDGSTLYYSMPLQNQNGIQGYDIRAASPENGPAKTLARIPGTRIPIWQGPHPTVSPDGKWLALPLNDSFGTDLWLISTKDGSMHRITDFGERRTYIARRVSWSSDSKYIVASVGDGDSDIVELDGLLKKADR